DSRRGLNPSRETLASCCSRLCSQDYLKTVVPSQLLAERGSNLVVINPGSMNVRMGFASQDVPFNIPHCIARHKNDAPKLSVRDQRLNCRAGSTHNAERERAYDIIASMLKIPFLGEVSPSENQPLPPKMGRLDGLSAQQNKDDSILTWTDVMDKSIKTSTSIERSVNSDADEDPSQSTSDDGNKPNSEENKYKEMIFGEDALKIPHSAPYCLGRPIRRGHFNISQNYSLHQVLEDLRTIWNWMLTEKLHINPKDRHLYSAILVLGETFDNREMKEMLSIVLCDLGFSTAVVHQEALAAAFGNGLSTACVVNIGAQVTQVVCVEDGVALPHTALALPYGGDDISRCLLWVQQRHRTWPNFKTDPMKKPIDMLMLNKIKEGYSQIRSGSYDAVSVVHSYEHEKSVGHQKTRLSALSVPPMGLLYPRLLIPEEFPPPPRPWFQDCDDMLEDTWQTNDGLSGNGGLGAWDSYQMLPTRVKKFDNIGLVEAIVSSVLSTGRVDLQRKLFCSIQLVGGAASTTGLAPVLEQRVLNTIPSNQPVEKVEVLQSRRNPLFIPWKGGVILGVLDTTRDAWIHREDWIKNGVHVGSGRKYKDSYFLQSQLMCYYNS
uniref:Actin-related protein 9 n=8 Tax=Aegilops tauschii subsp. strangulata TaxID=200361 RepID=A0A453AA82_AEGTS